MSTALPGIILTAGEPAGIGPDLCLEIAQLEWPASLTAIGDPDMLRRRAEMLGVAVEIRERKKHETGEAHEPGVLPCFPVPLMNPAVPGSLDAANAGPVVESIRLAAQACLDGIYDGMVTAPVNKAVINDAGIPFSGHTELIAGVANCDNVVMMLLAGDLRVALLTTHLPLRKVPDAITGKRIDSCLRIVHRDLVERFGIDEPRIAVCGLNPHAGEGGHLGEEDRDIIAPALQKLRAEGLLVTGPIPADTAFTPQLLMHADAVVAMYHDQGLPVLKHAGFGQAVNITLGLPILRTSVDHGTAIDLAGTGRAHAGSLQAATRLAIRLARQQRDRLEESPAAIQ